jgi:hypothetical protein
VALAFRILDHAGSVLRVQGVHDVEEVFTLDLSALRLRVWHVPHEVRTGVEVDRINCCFIASWYNNFNYINHHG